MKIFDVADPIHRGPDPAPNPVIKFIKDINPKEKTTRICEKDGNSSNSSNGNGKGKKNKKAIAEDDESEDDEVELDF